MSDINETKETAMIQNTQPQEPVRLPPQQSATDTTNWDNKVSIDPSGETYIRTLPNEE